MHADKNTLKFEEKMTRVEHAHTASHLYKQNKFLIQHKKSSRETNK
jgi:hypothetical protein